MSKKNLVKTNLCEPVGSTSIPSQFHSVIQLKRSTSSIFEVRSSSNNNSSGSHVSKKPEFNLSRFLVTNKKKTVVVSVLNFTFYIFDFRISTFDFRFSLFYFELSWSWVDSIVTNRKSSNQIFFSLEVKNNNKNRQEMRWLSLSNLAICIKKTEFSGFKA